MALSACNWAARALSFSARDALGPRAGARLLRLRHLFGQLFRQQPQRRLRIAHQSERDRVVLGDIVGVQVDVDDLGVGAERVFQQREHVRKHIRPDDDDGIGVLHSPAAGAAEHVTGQAPVERVRPRDVDLRGHRAPDAGAQRLRQLRQLRLRLRMGHAVAHDDHRVLGAGQQFGRARDQRRLRRHARLGNDGRQHRLVVLLVEDVLGDGKEGRSERRRRRHLDASSQQAKQAARVDGARCVLGHRPGEGDEVERHVRVKRVVGRPRLASDDDQRRALLAERLIEAAERVADADAAVELHRRRLLRRHGVAVRDQHQRRFLQAQDVADLGEAADLVEQPLLAAARIAEHRRDAVGFELLQQFAMTRCCGHVACSSSSMIGSLPPSPKRGRQT